MREEWCRDFFIWEMLTLAEETEGDVSLEIFPRDITRVLILKTMFPMSKYFCHTFYLFLSTKRLTHWSTKKLIKRYNTRNPIKKINNRATKPGIKFQQFQDDMAIIL